MFCSLLYSLNFSSYSTPPKHEFHQDFLVVRFVSSICLIESWVREKEGKVEKIGSLFVVNFKVLQTL